MYQTILALMIATGADCSLTVTLTGLASDEGKVRFFLADSKEAYGDHDRGKGFKKALIAPSGKEAVWEVGSLACGDYAVRAHHDEDDDGQLGHNFVGMPTESYAFSNDAKGFMGPPSWDDAKFTLDAPLALTLKADRP